MNTIEKLLYQVRKRACIYSILFRRAGIGILFFEGEDFDRANFEHHLVVYKYYPTLRAALRGELNRLKKLEADNAKTKTRRHVSRRKNRLAK